MNLQVIWTLKLLKKYFQFLKLKKQKKTIIFATHNRELANRADYKLFISEGNINKLMLEDAKNTLIIKIHTRILFVKVQ